MTARELVLVAHRWMGLPSSIILSIVGVTGAMIFLPRSWLLRRIAGRLHDSLALGLVGWWTVVIVTAVAVVLQLSGLCLWWRRKALRLHATRSLRRAAFDLHHAVGFVAFLLMLLLAATGVGRPLIRGIDADGRHKQLRSLMTKLHTAESFPLPVKALYALASTGFMIQGITGVIIWWTLRRAT
jgi:uncharacterized iron-regulated membrane protein